MDPIDDGVALAAYFGALQQRLIAAIEAIEGDGGARFRQDRWHKDAGQPLGGHGLTAIIEGGRVFERGGVAFSHVRGAALPASATARNRRRSVRSKRISGTISASQPSV